MAAADSIRNTRLLPAANAEFYRPTRILQGSTFTELEQVVEHAILNTRPPMTLGQIRLLLKVFDVCPDCDGEGVESVRGSYSDDMREIRCRNCKGRGTVPVPEPEVQ